MILLILGTIVLLYTVWKEYQKYKHIPGLFSILPGLPIKIPILSPYGFIHAYDEGPDLIRQNSVNGIMKLQRGKRAVVIVSAAELIKEVTIKNHKDFPKPSEVFKILDLYGPNIVSTNDDVWKNHRAIADPAFAEKHMHFLVSDTVKSTKLLFKRWNDEGLSKNGRLTTSPDKDMTDVTLDVIGKTNFGYDLEVFNENRSFDQKKHKMSFFDALTTASTFGLIVAGKTPDFMKPFFTYTNTVGSKNPPAVVETRAYMQELIEHRVENYEQARHDLFSLLVDSNMSQENQDEFRRRLTDQELISDVFIYLLAGHETSTTTLQWILYELCRNQHVLDKAIEEVDRVIGDRDVVFEDYENLSYLKAIMDETLRLHSPVSMVPKVARRDVTLGGFFVPKGTYVDVAISTVQTTAQYFEDPMKWNPERWTDGKKPVTCSYIPFSFGLRRCIGNTFSQIETVTILAMILKDCRIEFPKNDDKMNEIIRSGKIDTYTLVTKKPKYIKVDLVKRNK
ncbi:cytochrome P450 [Acrasis kona]|uniref:Cytochrome P450 n=1 Tax=Acrasis kona TaxID=1008807 RepID=A0AAW2Z503_9EUKA